MLKKLIFFLLLETLLKKICSKTIIMKKENNGNNEFNPYIFNLTLLDKISVYPSFFNMCSFYIHVQDDTKDSQNYLEDNIYNITSKDNKSFYYINTSIEEENEVFASVGICVNTTNFKEFSEIEENYNKSDFFYLEMIKKEEYGNLKSYISFIQKENNEAIMSFGDFDSQFDKGNSNKCQSVYGYYFGCQVLAIKIGVKEIYTPSTGKVEVGIFSISDEYLILPSKPGNETVFYYKNKIKELFGIECVDESNENDEMINITCDYFNYEDLPDLYFEMKGGIGVMALSIDMFKILANYKMEFKIKHRKKNDDNSYFNKWILGEPVTKNYNFFVNYTDKENSYVIIVPASLNGFIIILIATVGGFVFLFIFLLIIYCSARKENKYKNEFNDNKKMNLGNNFFSMDKNYINEANEEHENEIEENEKEESNKIVDDNDKNEIENNIILPKESKEEIFDKDNEEIKNLKINDIQNDNKNNQILNKEKNMNEKDINKKPNNIGVELISNNNEDIFDEKDTFM